MDKVINKIGNRIRYFRLRNGLSQEKLALAAGMNTVYIGHLERGLQSPTMTTLDKIVEALNVSYSEFFSEEKDENDTESRNFYTDIIESCIETIIRGTA